MYNKITYGLSVYDCLGRHYKIIEYIYKYIDGNLIEILCTIENDFGDKYENINSEFLYLSTEEFSDPEIYFIDYIKNNYWIDNTKRLYHINFKELYQLRHYFVQGFYTGYNKNEKGMQSTYI